MEIFEEQEISDIDDENPLVPDYHIKTSHGSRCTFYIEPLLVLFILAFEPLSLLLPQYIQQREWEKLMGNETYPTNSNNSCNFGPNSTDDPIKGNLTLVASATSYLNLQLSLASSLPTLISVTFLGPFSDKAGRKFALLLPSIGNVLGLLISFFIICFHLPIEMFIVSSFIVGCFGNVHTFQTGAMSYISDVTSKKDRSFRLIIVGVCACLPSILSSAVSGYILNVIGFTWAFLGFLILGIVIVLYIKLLIPETIQRDPDVTIFTLQYVKKAFAIFTKDNISKRRWKLLLFLFNSSLFAIISAIELDTFFVMNLPLCWGATMIGIYAAILPSVATVGAILFSKPLTYFLNDEFVVVIALIVTLAGNLYKYFVTTTAMMLASTVFVILYLPSSSTLQAMISKLVNNDETGAVFSGLAIIDVLCSLIGSAALNPLYSETVKAGHPSAAYLFRAAVLLISIFSMIYYAIRTKKETLKGSVMIQHTDED